MYAKDIKKFSCTLLSGFIFFLLCFTLDAGDKIQDENVDVDFSGSELNDAELRVFLLRVKRVDSLNLSFTKISDESLSELWRQKEISELGLSKCHISHIGLRELNKLTKLRVLDLTETEIDDKAIEEVVKLKSLGRNRRSARLPTSRKFPRRPVDGGGISAPWPARCGIAETLATGRRGERF